MARASQGPKRHEHHRFCKINAAGGGGGGGRGGRKPEGMGNSPKGSTSILSHKGGSGPKRKGVVWPHS